LNKKSIIVGIVAMSAILAVGFYMQNTSVFADGSGVPIKNQSHTSSDSKIHYTSDGKKIPKHDCGTDNLDCGSDD
jgi:hypothetical protein